MRSPGDRRGDLKQEVRSGIGKRGGGGQQEDFKRAPGKEGRGIGTWREQDGGPVSQTEVDGIGALAYPIQAIYAGSIGVGVRLSESKHHRRYRRAGYVHLRRLASPADLGGGSSGAVVQIFQWVVSLRASDPARINDPGTIEPPTKQSWRLPSADRETA